MINRLLSRRDFLKLGGLALVGLAVPPGLWNLTRQEEVFAFQEQGRVAYESVRVYDIPSESGQVIGTHWRDTVLTLTGATVDENERVHNRVWYQLGAAGYVHSSGIQPVRTVLNQPSDEIARYGSLAEVTVPFTDAYRAADRESKIAYRMYYETTYWVLSLERAKDGSAWYRFFDDKENAEYFAPAEHLRIVPHEELTQLSPDVDPNKKRVEVRLDQQLLIAYEDKRPVFVARVSTGRQYASGNYATPLGWHKTYHKRPTRHMASGNLAARGFDLPGIPWVCYITESGVAFHGAYWHNDFGRPRSHGCINMTAQSAKWLYRWTLPDVPPDKPFVYRRGTGTSVLIEARA